MRNARMMLFAMILALASVIGGCKKEDPVQNANPAAQGAQPQDPDPQAQAPAQAEPAPAASTISSKLPGREEKKCDPIKAGAITWGSEMAAFYGNGGWKTHVGTIFDEYDMCVEFVQSPDDNVRAQIDDYKAGKITFLRGTYPMIGKFASELCPTPNADLCIEPVMQLTFSAGDHLVCRAEIKDIKDLKGKTIALQKNGPHESFLVDILKDVSLTSKDVTIRFTRGITAENGPAELFKSDAKIDCAFVISPDRDALTGAEAAHIGTGAEGTVKGAHVVVSTIDRRTSIPDVYFVSHKFNTEHKDVVTKFVAAYLKSVEKMKALQHDYEDKSKGSEEFRGVLAFTMATWKDSCPDEAATFGLWSDASFVGLAGNVQFFDPTNPVGHKYFSNLSNDLAAELDNVTTRVDIQSANVDWAHSLFSNLVSGNVQRTARFNTEKVTDEIEKLNQTGMIASNSMISFPVYFAEDQSTFDEAQYGKDFDQAITYASKYTRAPIVIRGHVDSTVLMAAILQNGVNAGIIKQAGVKGAFTYSYNGSPLGLDNAKPILDLIQKERGAIDVDSRNKEGNPVPPPSKIVQAARDKSIERAGNVRDALIAYAAKKGVKLDVSQIQVIGAGASDPFIVKPRGPDDSAKNRRVEFSIVRVSAEAATASDYEL